jgi:quinol monooxygenase YgiN
MKFVQMIEYRTSRRDEFEALFKEWDEQSPSAKVRAIDCADRDQPGTYVTLVWFPSHEAAMENSQRPETTAMSERMMKLCEGEPVFRNLDVLIEPEYG